MGKIVRTRSRPPLRHGARPRVVEGDAHRDYDVRPLGGAPGCFVMLLVSVSPRLLTVLLNLALR